MDLVIGETKMLGFSSHELQSVDQIETDASDHRAVSRASVVLLVSSSFSNSQR